MRNDAFGPPLTVWVGPTRYVFPPGRDVVVGYGGRWDIPLNLPAHVPPHAGPTAPELVLRFTGDRWVAIDNSRNGIFLNGARVSTVDIGDGQAISIGDPQRGPRLVFQIGAHVPTQRTTQKIPIPPPRPAAGRRAAPPPAPPPVAPPPPPVPPILAPQPRAVEEQPTKGRGLIERVTDATRKLRARRAAPEAGEGREGGESVPTYRLPLKAGARTIGVAAYQLGLSVDGHEVLSDVSFAARPGTLTAVIGPSAAPSAALLGVLAGIRELGSGRITVDGHDIQAERESMRARIGIVPREDRVHSRLTVQQALGYAAELRLPPDTSAEHRQRVVDQILEELELTAHRSTRIGKLTPEFRRCAAMAIELISRPTLLVVDEPGAGLDADQESHVLKVLRRQADIGCVVVASMTSPTSLTHLDMCDQVLVLTPRGSMAFDGAPLHIGSAMATSDWSEVLAQVNADPEGAHRAFRARQHAQGPPAPPQVAEPWPPPAPLKPMRQIRLAARRQARLFFADRLYLLFLLALPFALAGLTLLIPGGSGLSQPGANSRNPHEAVEILAALNLAAVIIGTALTIREIVNERRIFRREQAVGLWAPAYLLGKIAFFGLAAAVLTAITFAIVVAVKGGPVHGALFLYDATFELYASVAGTAIVSAIVGLAVSTLGRSLREVVPLAVPVILASLLFAGGLLTLVGTWGYDQISWFVPAQWGFAASASTVDLRRVDPQAADVGMWAHYVGWWIFDRVMLFILGVAWAGIAGYRLRPARRRVTSATPPADPAHT
ncbi:transmembrane ABC transporter ATP-binding protein [Mycobacterium numidiamassiliense]|uniref:Transmembrane ABC transporter ATP-binding protein n=1 Tax=Mycobacterium numidiamassiliense TaxID=1841861 RepID=A0A2U3PDR6_9MYCO|nr:ATP-binding cassette domain-containing protein [Mycobacterium numidiamassiliense]SPM41883.1 transmembrane ABC transporter ATP-binding protein [Mycobacterium numidiamassiliense]